MTDFIIVGRGLAAAVISHVFYRSGISFKVIGDRLSNCSHVAAGIWNPVVFKRMTPSWMAGELVKSLNEFYTGCENTLGVKLLTQRTIYKPFTEDQEKTLWQKKAAGELSGFIDPAIYYDHPGQLKNCIIPNGYGVVKGGGSMDVNLFLNETARFFKNDMIDETFRHELLLMDRGLNYGGIEARNIIFCEGYLVKDNPFFSWLPLRPAKGEVLTVSSDELALDKAVFSKDGFLMDIGRGIYKLGATYGWKEISDAPTASGKNELDKKMAQVTASAYKTIKHEAGVRPASLDRRPLIGRHPELHNMYVFNGLGARGVMLAPYFAGKFVNFYLLHEELHDEVNIKRFYHLYGDKKKA